MTDVEERRAFDFWIGEWDLTWSGGTGRSSVRAVLDGAAILESFAADGPERFSGMSLSTVSPETGDWRQAWVDSSGGYLDFRGGMRAGAMLLERDGVANGRPVRQRMVWDEIERDALRWRWERSTDGGATWETLWLISYRRRTADARAD